MKADSRKVLIMSMTPVACKGRSTAGDAKSPQFHPCARVGRSYFCRRITKPSAPLTICRRILRCLLELFLRERGQLLAVLVEHADGGAATRREAIRSRLSNLMALHPTA